MTRDLYTYTYLDGNGNQVLQSNKVNSVCYYSTEGESWDRYGGYKASWYKEIDYPNDDFVGPNLSGNIWDYFSFRGTVSGVVDDGLHLSVSGTDSRGGVSSDGLWSLEGDFDVMVFLDDSSYYNEFRGTSAVGMSVSVSDSYRYRISKFFDGENIIHKTQKVEDRNLKYYGWFDSGDTDDISGSGSTCFRIRRSGDVIRSYVGVGGEFKELGECVSGTGWLGDAYVELELETDQQNTLRSTFSGFTCSGTIVPSGVFYSQYRGPDREFPVGAIILSDDYGMSIVDDSDMSLWMRFKYGADLFNSSNSPSISASNGRVYFTTSSGLHCIDFVEDKLKKYTKDYTAVSYSNITSRNVVLSY
jgi:hypothetical protein